MTVPMTPSVAGFSDVRPLLTADASAFGDIYEADQDGTGRRVVIKVLKPSLGPEYEARFAREWTLLARLKDNQPHLALPTVFQVAQASDGRWCAAMEPLGSSLQSHVRDHGVMQPYEALTHLDGLAKTLDEVHTAGVVHRDVRPPNVLFDRSGRRLHLSDFGIAADTTSGYYEEGGPTTFGVLSYFAPELIRKERSPSRVSDLWALTSTLWFLLTGELAFPQSDDDIRAAAHAHDLHPAGPAPAGLKEFFTWAFDDDPSHRYKTGQAWVAGLRHALAPPSPYAELHSDQIVAAQGVAMDIVRQELDRCATEGLTLTELITAAQNGDRHSFERRGRLKAAVLARSKEGQYPPFDVREAMWFVQEEWHRTVGLKVPPRRSDVLN